MTSPFPQQQTPSSQPGRDPRSVPDVEVPISGNPAHPVNAPGVSVYYSRTDNLVGLNTEQQTQALVDALRSTGPGKVLLLEANGPRDGSYVEELRRALPAALEQVPADQRPEIRLFISDGRPVVGSPNNQGQPYNDFAAFLQNLDARRPNSGTVQIDNSQAVPRAVPNWNNPEVVDFYMRERVQPAVDLAKQLGIGTVVIDDHIGVPPGANMTAFKRINGLDDRGATNVISGAYERAFGIIERAGLESGLSVASEPGVYTNNGPTGALRFGIDVPRIAQRGGNEIVEVQAYRETSGQVQAMADRVFENVRDNFDRYRGVDEFKFALATRANGQNLTEDTLVAQQRIIDRLEDRLGDLYRSRGAEPPQVTTSLWAHQHFHEEATLRQGDEGNRVTQLQQALNTAGIRVDGKPLVPDGDFGGNTQRAVSQFQQQQGLPATGVADKDTQVALGVYPGLRFQTPEPVQSQPSPQPAPQPAPQPTPPVTPPTSEQPVTPAPAPAPVPVQPQPVQPPVLPTTPDQPVATLPTQPVAQVPPGLYREGSRGEGVRALQEALIRNGAQIDADGDFGPMTRRAVESYQRANGLQADGVVGPQTIAHINDGLRQSQIASTPSQSFAAFTPTPLAAAQSAADIVTRDPLYPQAQEALKKLPAGTFANLSEMDNMAGVLVRNSRKDYPPPSEMASITEAKLNTRGDGVIALEQGGDNAMQKRASASLTEGKHTTLADSGRAMQEDGVVVAQRTGQQNTAQIDSPAPRPEQQANPVLTAQNSPQPDQEQPARGMRVS